MVASKLISLFALSSVAVLICSFGAAPVTAVSLADSHKLARNLGHGHSEIAKRKKKRSSGSSSRCKKTSSALPSSTVSASHTSTESVPVSTTSKTSTTTPTSTEHHTTPKPTSSAPPPPPPPAPTSSKSNSGGGDSSSAGSSKLGIGWGGVGNLAMVKNSNTKYIYNWGSSPPGGASSLGFTYMSMLWGNVQDKINGFLSTVNSGEVGCLMGPNEIDQSGQANISGQEAANLWKQYIEPHRNGRCTVSPSVSSAPDGVGILQDFFNACSDCTIDYTSVHWYGTEFSQLQTYLEQMHSQFGRPVMLTEVADNSFTGGAQPNLSQVRSFYSQLVGFTNSVDWLIVFPFLYGVSENGVDENNALMTSDAQLTQLGKDLLDWSI